MSPATRMLAWTGTAAVTVTGVAYAVMAYCLPPADAMDVVNHPWQPTALYLHLLAAPLCVFAFGVLWQDHVLPKLRQRSRSRRRSGLLVLACAVPMAVSGYLLQVSVDESWRASWVWVHVATSVAWLVLLAVHVLLPMRVPAAG